MKLGRLIAALATALAVLAPPLPSQTEVRSPYVDPAQLDVPWPKHSHHKQPWRGFLETKSGYDFANGIGINYNAPGGRISSSSFSAGVVS